MTTTATFTELYKRNFAEMMKDVATSIPGHIISFDPRTQLAQVQIGVVRIDVRGTVFTPPPLIEVPVYFAGGKWVVEYQIDPKDEGVIFLRFHDINDAMFLPGIRSLNNVITDFANDGIRIRNEDGTHYVWIKGDGTIESTNGTATDTLAPDGTITRTNGAGNITMSPDGTVNINGAIITPDGAISSPVSATAPTVTGSTSLVVAGKEVKEHIHAPGSYAAGGDAVTGTSGAL